MTTKEKAERIFYSMYNVDDIMGNYPMCFDTAKKCAIIAVDTVLETIMTGYLRNNKEVANFQIEKMIYWQEVKEELIKLKQ